MSRYVRLVIGSALHSQSNLRKQELCYGGTVGLACPKHRPQRSWHTPWYLEIHAIARLDRCRRIGSAVGNDPAIKKLRLMNEALACYFDHPDPFC